MADCSKIFMQLTVDNVSPPKNKDDIIAPIIISIKTKTRDQGKMKGKFKGQI